MYGKVLAGIALIGALTGIIGAAHMPAEDTVTPAEQAAADMGIAIDYTSQINCGNTGHDAAGCYAGRFKIQVLDYLTDEATEYVIWHELGHVLSARDGLNWSEADCDAYADQMTN